MIGGVMGRRRHCAELWTFRVVVLPRRPFVVYEGGKEGASKVL